MKIGIDARFWGPSGTGLGKYIEKLVLNLEPIDRENQYFIFLRQENFDLYEPKNPNFQKVLADFRWYSLKEQISFPFLISRLKLDLMHFGHFNVPLIYALFSSFIFPRYLVTIHDLIKHEFAGQSSTTRSPLVYWFKHSIYRLVFQFAIFRAKNILVPSNWVKNMIIDKFSLKPEKITVTYEAGGEEFKQTVKDSKLKQTLKKYNLAGDFLIYVGNVYPYKNIAKLLSAFKILKTDQKFAKLKLVLGCARNVFLQRIDLQIKKESLENEVLTPGFIPTEDLVCLYKKARAYIFPSLSEGFGIPGLDAMTAGLPVISSNASCLPEIYSDAALYFDPKNENDLAQKIKEVLTSENLRQNLIQKGLAHAQTFSWQKMAQQTLSIYCD